MASVHPAPLLEKQRIFGSRDPEQARAFLRSKEFRFELSRREVKQLDLRINGVYLAGVYVGYIQYGSPAEIRTNPARDDYWLQLPIQEEIEFGIAREPIACGPARAVVSSPMHPLLIKTKGVGARLNVSLSAVALSAQLAALLGETPAAPLAFAPVVDLTAGYGRSLAQQIRLAVMDIQRAGALRWDASTISMFEQFVMCTLLLSHPNNYSDALGRRDRALTPRNLRRALDYMHAHLTAPITVADIAAAAGITGRTLFQYFRDFRSTSPMRYLRDARFERVRDALQRPRSDEGVAEIATSCGFSHLGRFASEYRTRFGESPSETMRNSRQHTLPQIGK
jgi:AraC-like DNA-binding protein